MTTPNQTELFGYCEHCYEGRLFVDEKGFIIRCTRCLKTQVPIFKYKPKWTVYYADKHCPNCGWKGYTNMKFCQECKKYAGGGIAYLDLTLVPD